MSAASANITNNMGSNSIKRTRSFFRLLIMLIEFS
jgi:hypothetical protein